MTTCSEDRAFAKEVFKKTLEEAVTWICQNLNPESVFDPEDLEAWAEDNGYKKEVHTGFK